MSEYEAACLLAFGLAALLAALILVGQAVARYASAAWRSCWCCGRWA